MAQPTSPDTGYKVRFRSGRFQDMKYPETNTYKQVRVETTDVFIVRRQYVWHGCLMVALESVTHEGSPLIESVPRDVVTRLLPHHLAELGQ